MYMKLFVSKQLNNYAGIFKLIFLPVQRKNVQWLIS